MVEVFSRNVVYVVRWGYINKSSRINLRFCKHFDQLFLSSVWYIKLGLQFIFFTHTFTHVVWKDSLSCMKRAITLSSMFPHRLFRSFCIALIIALFIGAAVLSFNNHSQASTSYLQLADATTSTKVPYGDGNPLPTVSWCPACSS